MELELPSWSGLWLVVCFFEESAFLPFIWVALRQACQLGFASWPADQIFDGITYCCCCEDRVAHSLLINLVVCAASLAGLRLRGA